MPLISEKLLSRHNQMVASMCTERSQWEKLWRELSDNYLPQRYRTLMQAKEFYANRARRQYIINNTGTQAARTLAAGMMNGITSPSRPWFKLRVPGQDLEDPRIAPLAIWLEQVERILLQIMAESNFYNSMAVMYLDLVVFGTAANLIYEDRDTVIRCYNPPLGEFYLALSDRNAVDIFARKFIVKVHQYVRRWPDRRYWSDYVKLAVERGGSALNQDVEISHFIAPNLEGLAPSRFEYYEMYWESRRKESAAMVLELKGFNELPGIFARWETSGNDAYGVGPGMDALGDNIELQHLHRNKGQMLEMVNRPPMLVDISMQNSPSAFFPGAKTFVPSLATSGGAKPAFQVDPRFDQLNMDQVAIETRIKNTFFNFLFNNITDLQTVRSAAEIAAREGERLVLLGGVLERFESEGLDPGILRIFRIAERAGLLPPPPPMIRELDLEIQYVSILSVAQRAAGTAPTERFLALIGNLAAVYPGALDVPNFDTMLLNYARDIGVRQSELKGLDQIIAERQQRDAMAASAQAIEAGGVLAQGAKNLSQTDVGGGANLLQQVLGGGPLGPTG